MPKVGREYVIEIEGSTTRYPYGTLDGRRVYVVCGGNGLVPGNCVNVRILDRTANGSHNYLASVRERPPIRG